VSYIGFHVRRNNQAGFLDAQWRPLARLTLSAGARAEDNADFGTRVVPRVGAAYALRIAGARSRYPPPRLLWTGNCRTAV